jgi:hypothetical protein
MLNATQSCRITTRNADGTAEADSRPETGEAALGREYHSLSAEVESQKWRKSILIEKASCSLFRYKYQMQ